MRPADYAYSLPAELVALEPAKPRDSSRLFVYDTRTNTIKIDHFYHLAHYIPEQSLMVMNETRVIPFCIVLHKTQSGGKVQVLVLLNERPIDGSWLLMCDRRVQVGEVLQWDERRVFTIIAHSEGSVFRAHLSADMSESDLLTLLQEHGTMPIPLYLRKTTQTNTELKTTYQTTFARKNQRPSKTLSPLGSVAAPTASLHFTESTFQSLYAKQVALAKVSLEVGMGTFAPVTPEHVQSRTLHTEWYSIPPDTARAVSQSKESKRPVIAVGTTVVRVLESFANDKERLSVSESDYYTTNIFIQPGFTFTTVDHLLTNFHQSESSLMMLVDAFLRHKKAKKGIHELYERAIKERFRFYSFGDAMLIL